MVDMDQDSDTDILYTNGDTFDNSYVNASHGIQWLENLGNLDFDYHRLADMTGAYCALAGDIDLDGDLDVIAAASLPRHVPSLRCRYRDSAFDSVPGADATGRLCPSYAGDRFPAPRHH